MCIRDRTQLHAVGTFQQDGVALPQFSFQIAGHRFPVFFPKTGELQTFSGSLRNGFRQLAEGDQFIYRLPGQKLADFPVKTD